MAVEGRRAGRLHPKDRSVSGGRRQPSLLLREECGEAAGEEGRRRRNVYTQGEYQDELYFGLTREEFDALLERL